jgi:hypothetical protein
MTRVQVLEHEFVDFIPHDLASGRIYISIDFAIAVHACCCGCGGEVATPITPQDWSLTYDGESISLDPSIGNKQFDCRSHYWVRNGRVHWLPPFHMPEAPVHAAERGDHSTDPQRWRRVRAIAGTAARWLRRALGLHRSNNERNP